MKTVSKPADCQTAWFALLERARLSGDYALAERATAELKRLGVEITFRPPTPTQGATDAR